MTVLKKRDLGYFNVLLQVKKAFYFIALKCVYVFAKRTNMFREDFNIKKHILINKAIKKLRVDCWRRYL